MDFGLVKEMKVSMYIGLFDDTCPLTNSVETYQQLGSASIGDWIIAPWQGHCPWGAAYSDWATEQITHSLMINADV